MEAFSLAILFVAILGVVAWGIVDSAINDREGVRRKRAADAEAQQHLAKSIREALRARR